MYNILICDDDRDIVKALRIYLSAGDYRIFEACTGSEAIDMVRREDIHLILMDIMMPVMDGISATELLRRDYNIPIILLTAKSESSDKILGGAYGVTAGSSEDAFLGSIFADENSDYYIESEEARNVVANFFRGYDQDIYNEAYKDYQKLLKKYEKEIWNLVCEHGEFESKNTTIKA